MNNKINYSLIFPKKTDYPRNLELLNKKTSSNLYRQIVESSASAYFETNFLTRYFFQKRFEQTLKLIGNKKKLNILDAGCGIGFFLSSLSRIAKHIWAVDYAKYSLDYAKYMSQKRKLRNITFSKVNLIKKLPFSTRKFDLVVCLSVLEHIKDLDIVCDNFRRVLKNDGILIAGYPNEDNFIFRFFQYIEKRFIRPKVFRTFQGTKLNHVSRANQINNTLKKYFLVKKECDVKILPGIIFYKIQKCSSRRK